VGQALSLANGLNGWRQAKRILEPGREFVTAVFATQIELDGQGVAWIGDTRVKVIEVVLDKIAYGWSPEEIHFQHPHLSLAQIHGALTYYYEHQSELDAQIRQGLDETDKLAAAVSDAEFRRKLSDPKYATIAC
jgi:uncharacterized protein (DUF433 family)